ncbi:MAG: malonyl-CoA decarboxylase family protein, partial [Pseudomonadota bacterium]
ADMSKKGVAQSHGVMVNYLYDLDEVTQNHERFATLHEVAASSDIQTLVTSADAYLSSDAKI